MHSELLIEIMDRPQMTSNTGQTINRSPTLNRRPPVPQGFNISIVTLETIALNNPLHRSFADEDLKLSVPVPPTVHNSMEPSGPSVLDKTQNLLDRQDDSPDKRGLRKEIAALIFEYQHNIDALKVFHNTQSRTNQPPSP
ncbi:hypothetical protein D9611_014661 [Ephemerocybe angulata]|uniref:Uncharacterized protein n=1 Tax=Ephemerocybe angulata TaxID=980116 RepID=A0A8H5AQY7_9AGAR|nr:hypothetical protein D9611_014661 [Tulosesus angulatus]